MGSCDERIRSDFLATMRRYYPDVTCGDEKLLNLVAVYLAGRADGLRFSGVKGIFVLETIRLSLRLVFEEEPLERWKWWNQQTEESQPKEPECPPT